MRSRKPLRTPWELTVISSAWLLAASSYGGEPSPAEPAVEIAPMSDPAIQGTVCLGAAATSMGAAYAMGPTELLMLASGAMHVPTSSSVLFIPLFSILGVGSCALGAAATPSVRWLINQSDEIAGQVNASVDRLFADENTPVKRVKSIRPMTEPEVQSAGCTVGALSAFGASMASSPMEVAMLSSGATIIVSSTPMLAMGLLATIVASGCGIGSFAAVPITSFVSNFDAIGNTVLGAFEDGFRQLTGMFSDGESHPMAVNTWGKSPTSLVKVSAALPPGVAR